MPNRKDSKQKPGDAGQHNDWGQRQGEQGGNAQSDAGGNLAGAPDGQPDDVGLGDADAGGGGQAARAAGRKRQGVIPGEEMGHLQSHKNRR
jgi:hypothetical protein